MKLTTFLHATLSFIYLSNLANAQLLKNEYSDGDQSRNILYDPDGLDRYNAVDNMQYWDTKVTNPTHTEDKYMLPDGDIGTNFVSFCWMVARDTFDQEATKNPKSNFTLLAHMTIPPNTVYANGKIVRLTCSILQCNFCKEDGSCERSMRVISDFTKPALDRWKSYGIFDYSSITPVTKGGGRLDGGVSYAGKIKGMWPTVKATKQHRRR